MYAVLVASIAFDFSIPYLRDEYIATLMLCVFSIATFPGDSIINYDAKWLSYLGRISYGIYLFHIFAIVFAIKLCIHVFHFRVNNYAELGILCLVTMLFAITLGWISYNGYEKYFLRLKKRFAKV